MTFSMLLFRFFYKKMCYYYAKILKLFVNVKVYLFARFIAFARFIVERNLIVIETTVENTVSIFAQRESILRAELFMCVFYYQRKLSIRYKNEQETLNATFFFRGL